jgi:hypothetical protein
MEVAVEGSRERPGGGRESLTQQLHGSTIKRRDCAKVSAVDEARAHRNIRRMALRHSRCRDRTDKSRG